MQTTVLLSQEKTSYPPYRVLYQDVLVRFQGSEITYPVILFGEKIGSPFCTFAIPLKKDLLQEELEKTSIVKKSKKRGSLLLSKSVLAREAIVVIKFFRDSSSSEESWCAQYGVRKRVGSQTGHLFHIRQEKLEQYYPEKEWFEKTIAETLQEVEAEKTRVVLEQLNKRKKKHNEKVDVGIPNIHNNNNHNNDIVS